MLDADTIVAIASGAGQAGIGIVRVSGDKAQAIASVLTGQELRARQASLVRFYDAAGNAIDQGIALFFKSPRSYTGEDVLELHGHGGATVLRMLVTRCLELGARIAEPGEFTRRAFLNEKLDLAQAEAVADLIGAATQTAARCAIRSLQGEFSNRVHALQHGLTDLRVKLEALLDFPEEGIEPAADQAFSRSLDELRNAVEATFAAAQAGRVLRDGLTVAIIGPPNVGKSSIINRLSKCEVAIVSPVPGTTRDLVRQSIDMGGVPVHIVDTAGLRASEDPIEALGMGRTWKAVETADVVLVVTDCTQQQEEQAGELHAKIPPAVRQVRVHNKIDLLGLPARRTRQGAEAVWISAATGEGITQLEDCILDRAQSASFEDNTFIARARHLQALQIVRDSLAAAKQHEHHEDLLAEELRVAQRALSELTGEFAADDLLGEIFSRFCIGK
jgi:tRNA modification GTPase